MTVFVSRRMVLTMASAALVFGVAGCHRRPVLISMVPM
jgi:hypothetical protein